MRRWLALAAVLGVIISAWLCPAAAGAATGTVMSVVVDSARVDVGGAIDAKVVLETDVETMAAQCSISFNPAVLECTGVALGDFYQADIVMPGPDDVIIDNVQGTVQTMSICMLGSVPAKTGTFLVYHFRAKAEGISYLDLSEVDPTGHDMGTVVNDAYAQPILSMAVNNGTLYAGTQPVADLTVTGLSLSWVVPGQTYSTTYTVENQGDSPVNAFNMGVYVDGASQPLAAETIPSLGAGGSYTGTFSGRAIEISGDNDTVRVCSDVDGACPEGLEDNNCREDVFEQVTYTLRIILSPNCDITATAGDQKWDSIGTFQVPLGRQLDVVGVADEGYECEWTGDLSGQPTSTSLTMDQDYALELVATRTAPSDGDGGSLSTPAMAGIIAAAGLGVAVLGYGAFRLMAKKQ